MNIFLLDYGAGNVQSIENAITTLGHSFKRINSCADFDIADKIIFPGVGNFGKATSKLRELGYDKALKNYISKNGFFMGICVGMQCLFEGSEEDEEKGLGIIPATIKRFSGGKSVPQIGWNSAVPITSSEFIDPNERYYFVHSYAAITTGELFDWAHTLTTYGNETFVSSVKKGNVFATQFHPEKSGKAGLQVLQQFLLAKHEEPQIIDLLYKPPKDMLSKRIIACLDVRTNDHGDLVVTKGDQYDVRETKGDVRNLGKPVELATRYYNEGADEITFLNITSFREFVIEDNAMLQVLKETSKNVFVPLTIGGGIRDMQTKNGIVTALEVAGEYFRNGADKVSIGSEAVYLAEKYIKGERGMNTITSISKVYGAQAVVISVDPKRIWVKDKTETEHFTCKSSKIGPNGEQYCWYQCTVKGGRELRDLDVVQLTTSCESLGAGEILLNSMDADGSNSGYDHDLISMVKKAVSIPVIASSGAGNLQHFESVFRETGVDAALAAGIFHRKEVGIQQVKEYLEPNFPIRK